MSLRRGTPSGIGPVGNEPPLTVDSIVQKPNRLTPLFTSFILLGFASAFGVAGVLERSHDLGVYFAGAAALNDGSILYETVADHKGPLLYLYLQLIQSIFGFTLVSAAISLTLVTLFWLVSALFLAHTHKLSTSAQLLTVGVASLALQQQGGNAIIAMFSGALTLFSLSALEVFRLRGKPLFLALGLAAGLLLFLVRIDGLAISLICVFLALAWTKQNPESRSIAGFAGGAALFISFWIVSWSLQGLTISNWIFANIQFGLMDYGSLQDGSELPVGNLQILISTGLLSVAFLLVWRLFVSATNFQPEKIALAAGLIFSLALLFLSGKDTNYYLFPLYSFLIFGLVQFSRDARVSDLNLIALFLTPLVLVTLASLVARLECADQRLETCLAAKSGSSKLGISVESISAETAVMVSDGWPWVEKENAPDVLFSPDLPATLGYLEEEKFDFGALENYEFIFLRPSTYDVVSRVPGFPKLELVSGTGPVNLYKLLESNSRGG